MSGGSIENFCISVQKFKIISTEFPGRSRPVVVILRLTNLLRLKKFKSHPIDALKLQAIWFLLHCSCINSIALTLITKLLIQQLSDLFLSIQFDNSLSISGKNALLVNFRRNRFAFWGQSLILSRLFHQLLKVFPKNNSLPSNLGFQWTG